MQDCIAPSKGRHHPSHLANLLTYAFHDQGLWSLQLLGYVETASNIPAFHRPQPLLQRVTAKINWRLLANGQQQSSPLPLNPPRLMRNTALFHHKSRQGGELLKDRLRSVGVVSTGMGMQQIA